MSKSAGGGDLCEGQAGADLPTKHTQWTRKATILDYLFWWWLATFRPRAFLHLYGDRYDQNQPNAPRH